MKKTEHLPLDLVLPHSIATLLSAVDESRRHSGLQLDKLSPPGNQELQKQEITRICRTAAAPDLLLALSKRRATMLTSLQAEQFRASTTGPLTLHLARASGLENAGIHLHPVYGFACLPGSGLKGMARAWAETVWLADQENRADAWNEILAVFGWAPRSEDGKCWKPKNADEPKGSRTGSVVFHDAWPMEWPRLEPDIINNHHKGYYAGTDDPGDWEKPEMAHFLSVATDTAFDFALTPRIAADGEGSRRLTLALKWLQAALTYGGAGAKTNAGYGRFQLEGRSLSVPSAARSISTHTLELVTPAFLAGVRQEQEDCDLRSATLRGHLRWWWRTMHAAHLNREDLVRLETAIWGNAKNSGALALFVRSEKGGDRRKFDKTQVAKHLATRNSQGIQYAAYGMDETRYRKRRWYIKPGSRWTLTLNARCGRVPKDGPSIGAADVLRQGQIALWLLCRFGGVGSKARNGFGSFADVEIDAIECIQDCKEAGAKLRRAASMGVRRSPSMSSNLDDMLEPLEFPIVSRDHWFVLDQLGQSMQSFARKNKHDERKATLGLPRKIHGPGKDPMPRQIHKYHRPPKFLLSAHGRERVASPVHYHLARDTDGAFIVRLTAFPSPVLPDVKTSRAVLEELRNHIASELAKPMPNPGKRGKMNPTGHNSSAVTSDRSGAAASLPKPGERVSALLLEEKTKKGGWKAKDELTGLQGPLQNSSKVPGDAVAGQRVSLIVASAKMNQISFNWLTPEIEVRLMKQSGKREQRGGRTNPTKKGRR